MAEKHCKDCAHSEKDFDLAGTWGRHCWRGKDAFGYRDDMGPVEWMRSEHGLCGPKAKYFKSRPTQEPSNV